MLGQAKSPVYILFEIHDERKEYDKSNLLCVEESHPMYILFAYRRSLRILQANNISFTLYTVCVRAWNHQTCTTFKTSFLISRQALGTDKRCWPLLVASTWRPICYLFIFFLLANFFVPFDYLSFKGKTISWKKIDNNFSSKTSKIVLQINFQSLTIY